MHETTPPVPGDVETNYGTLGAVGNGYYADWNQNNGSPGDQWIQHQFPGALVNDPDGAAEFNMDGNLHQGLVGETPEERAGVPTLWAASL